MGKRQRFSVLFLAIALLGLGACSRDKAPDRAHAGPVSLVPSAQSPAQPNVLAGDPELATIAALYKKRFAVATELEANATSEDRLFQIVNSLAGAVLKQEHVRNPRLQDDDAFIHALTTFNHAVLKAANRKAARLASSGLIERYVDFVLENCPDSLAYCQNLPFFAKDSTGSSAVILLAAKTLEGKIEALRADKPPGYFAEARRLLHLYRTIYTVFNSAVNADFLLRYVKYSGDIEAYLKTLTPAERKARGQDLAQHQGLLNTSLLLLSREKDPEARATYCDFMIGLKPYTLNMAISRENSLQGFRKVVREFISCAAERGTIDKLIQDHLRSEKDRHIATEITDLTAIKDVSYYYALNYLKQTPEVLENLGIKNDTRTDTAFFVIDRLFYDAIDQDLATEYWKQIKNFDDVDLLDFIENYVKMQTAYVLKATQAIVAKAITTEYAKTGLASDLYSRIVDRVNQATQFEWEMLKTRIRKLNGFVVAKFDERLARTSDPSRRAAAEKYALLTNKLDAIDEHINYIATSTVMLAMSYYMSKAPGQVKIFISWFSGTNQWANIDGSKALATFFNKQENWIRFFNYGTQDFYFDEFQVKHVFDFALRTGLFDTVPFGVMAEDNAHKKIPGGDALNNEFLFFRQYIESRLRKHLVGVQKSVDEIENTIRNKDFVDRFRSFCVDPLNAAIDIPLDQLGSSVFLGTNALKTSVEKIYSTGGQIRVLEPDREQVEDLLEIFRHHFYGPGAERRLSAAKLAARDQIYAAIKGELERYYKGERELLNRVLSAEENELMRREANCFLRFHKAELFRQNVLYRKNVEFYKDVHAALTLLRAFPEKIEPKDIDGGKPVPVALRALAVNLIDKWNRDLLNQPRLESGNDRDVYARLLKIADIAFHPEVWAYLETLPGFSEQSIGQKVATAINGMFQPQNVRPVFVKRKDEVRRTEETIEYGIHVNKPFQSFAESKILLQPKSELTREGFRHTKRDTYLRIRRQLQTTRVNARAAAEKIGLAGLAAGGKDVEIPLAPNVQVPIGTFAELANDRLFTNNEVMTAIYSASQKEFIEEAMSQFAGDNRNGNQFVNWHNSAETAGLAFLRLRYNFLKDLFDAGPKEISQSPVRKCDRDAWQNPIPTPSEPMCRIYEVGIEKLLQQRTEIVNLYRVDDEEKAVLEWIQRPGRFHEAAVAAFKIKDSDDTADWTYFDSYYKTSFVGRDASRSDGTSVIADRIDGSYVIELFRDSFRLRIRPERHLFALNDFVTRVDRTRVRKPLLQQIARTTALEEIILDLEDRDGPLPPEQRSFGDFIFEKARNVRTDSRYFADDWRYIGIDDRKEGERAGTPIYLRDDEESAKAWFRKAIQAFVVSETSCEVLPLPSDPDFGLLPEAARDALTKPAECRERFAAWQKGLDEIRERERARRRESANKTRDDEVR